MAKKAVNIRLRKDQLAAIKEIADSDKQQLLDRSKIVSVAVDEYLDRRRKKKVGGK
jgi:metal-responsive CopG/Arc/MetJ family transcriptional regulator